MYHGKYHTSVCNFICKYTVYVRIRTYVRAYAYTQVVCGVCSNSKAYLKAKDRVCKECIGT